ncbi:ribosome maturation factor RimP [Rhodococcus sp. SGAir0479]|uniref:ribosome maturation factor RimP n=1 Tax=Rhodococcus sp. SGAir0479 TaxID=2567884 RepID=UPI0010CD2EFB|nr:ribosome maturation factor RimP [Rhodococcus sp. SGAir0479]QCQ90723.1 ribosome maturation factor RimP [Rhodococcus sp. SGAir0479]
MPVPSRERVIELLAEPIEREGFDLEDVIVTAAGRHSSVRVMVDSDAGLELDEVARLSHVISEVFDAAPDFGESPYTLEVTSPGIDRPLTEERHWRRARGRKALVELETESITGRVGRLDGGAVDLVVKAKGGPEVRRVELKDVKKAVVQVEFSRPDAKELELAGGIPEGRVTPADADASNEEEVEGSDK